MINVENKEKKDFRIKQLQLFYKSQIVNLETNACLENINCVFLNCQSMYSREKRQKLIQLLTVNNISIAFLTKTWLSIEVMNSENCQRSSYQIVSRCDRNYGEHGGVFMISDNKNLTISDLSIPDFPFSVACVVPSNTSLLFFLVFYNPDSNSRYHESVGTPTACLLVYIRSFKSYSLSHNYGANFDVFILGDFNLPGVKWQTNTGTTTFERAYLDVIGDFGMNQLINVTTRVKGNCLDLIFGTVDSLLFSIPITRLSDHFPVVFEIEILSSIKSANYIENFSKSIFSKQMFSANLNNLYNSFSNHAITNFPSYWYSLLHAALSSSSKRKRQKRLLMPHYYSSHTMHLIIMRASNERKLEQNWNLGLSLRQMRLNSDLSDSIELDKIIYVESFNTQDSNHDPHPKPLLISLSCNLVRKLLQRPNLRHNCLTSFLDQSLVRKLSLILCFLPLKSSTCKMF